MADDVRIIIDFETKDKELSKALKNANTGVKKLSSNITKTKKNFTGLGTIVSRIAKNMFSLRGAFLAFVSVFAAGKIISLAEQQEDAINQLNVALRASGKFSREASEDIQQFASSLQQSSRFGDELILENAALIQSLGALERDGLKKATQAAADMSAALGIDLRAAATLVGKAAAGEIGSFSRYGVVIKRGADNAETFANALEELNSKFGGAAAGQLNTFAGATAQLSNTFGDLLEVIGDLIIKNPIAIELIKSLQEIFKSLGNAVKESSNEIMSGLVAAFVTLLKTIRDATGLIAVFAGAFRIAFNVVTIAFSGLSTISSILIGQIKNVIDLIQAFRKDGFKGVKDAFSELRNPITNIKDAINGIKEDASDIADAFDPSEWLDPVNEGLDTTISKIEEAAKKARTLGGGPDQQAPERGATDIIIGGAEAFGEEISKSGATLAASVFQGAEGAKKALSTAASAAGTALFGPVGAAAGPIFEALSAGPEQVEMMVSQFADAIPQLIESVVRAIGPALGVLAEKIPDILVEIAKNLDVLIEDLIVGIINNLPRIIKSLALAMPRIAVQLAISLVAQAPRIAVGVATALAKEMPNVAKAFVDELVDKLKSAGGLLGGSKGGGSGIVGKVTGAIGGFAGKLGFAEGGFVPSGFPNDTFPARLTEREFVVNNKLTPKMERFFNNQDASGGNATTNALLAQIVGLLGSQNKPIELKLNERTLATSILDLNRNNQRLA